MGPAIGVRWVGGLVTAQALTATAHIEPDGKPGSTWLIVEKNGVAQGIVERTLTVGLGEAGEG